MDRGVWLAAVAALATACGVEAGAVDRDTVVSTPVAVKSFDEGTASSAVNADGDIATTLTSANGVVLATMTWHRATRTYSWTVSDGAEHSLSGEGAAESTTPDGQNDAVHVIWARMSPRIAQGEAHACCTAYYSDSSCFITCVICSGESGSCQVYGSCGTVAFPGCNPDAQ